MSRYCCVGPTILFSVDNRPSAISIFRSAVASARCVFCCDSYWHGHPTLRRVAGLSASRSTLARTGVFSASCLNIVVLHWCLLFPACAELFSFTEEIFLTCSADNIRREWSVSDFRDSTDALCCGALCSSNTSKNLRGFLRSDILGLRDAFYYSLTQSYLHKQKRHRSSLSQHGTVVHRANTYLYCSSIFKPLFGDGITSSHPCGTTGSHVAAYHLHHLSTWLHYWLPLPAWLLQILRQFLLEKAVIRSLPLVVALSLPPRPISLAKRQPPIVHHGNGITPSGDDSYVCVISQMG